MVSRMSGSEIPTEEAELITNEFKRVKGREGRFKVIKKKISVGDIRRVKSTQGFEFSSRESSKVISTCKGQKKLSPIDSIIKSLSNIVKILQERNSLLKKQKARDRRESRRQRKIR